ncbi:hypothetical protein D9M68_777870 [compost metagenome]
MLLDVAVDQPVVKTLHGDAFVSGAGQQDGLARQVLQRLAELQPVHLRHRVVHHDHARLQEAVDIVDLAVDPVDIELDGAALGQEGQVVVRDPHRQEAGEAGGIGLADPLQRFTRVGEGDDGARGIHLERQAVDERFAVVDQDGQDRVMEDRQVPVMRVEGHDALASGPAGRGSAHSASRRAHSQASIARRGCLARHGAAGGREGPVACGHGRLSRPP